MIIYNARIMTMNKSILDMGYIKIGNGKIMELGVGKPPVISEDDIDAMGKTLLPGFIDSHTHIGIIEDGLGFEGDDSNEETDPITPHLRALDGINPLDRCFEEAIQAGITTVLISPGSANAICGEICAVKTVGKRIDDMVIKTVAMKFALGENPKTVYNDKNATPVTRMATVALIREALFKAKKYDEAMQKSIDDEEIDSPEFDMKCEALLPLLKKKISAHFHCHRADDIFTAIRICKEFDIHCVLVHATEGYKIAEILGKEKVDAIVGPIICDRSKPEMRELSNKNAGILVNHGVRVSICTDHPVIPVQYLPLSGAIAVKGGLNMDYTLEAMTIKAAQICGISDRVGSITNGKDADLCLWEGNPLDAMNSPALVMVNGEIIFKK